MRRCTEASRLPLWLRPLTTGLWFENYVETPTGPIGPPGARRPRRDFVDAYGQAAGRAFGSTRSALRRAEEPVRKLNQCARIMFSGRGPDSVHGACDQREQAPEATALVAGLKAFL
jgi:hypothetical protein